jgi:hypothetical protein
MGHWAGRFALATRSQIGSPLNGGIAQLGERLLCKQEVVGSIPSASTITHAQQDARHGTFSFFDIVYRKRSEV